MRIFKCLFTFAFLLLFSFASSAQAPKISWKNLQTKYERFEDIKPIIVNESDKAIYFDCLLNNIDQLGFYAEGSYNMRLLNFDEENNRWFWNVMICGTLSKDERKRQKKEAERIAKLKREGKYIPAGCKINPKEEFILDFSPKQWMQLVLGDGSAVQIYKSGKFRFEVLYDWENSDVKELSVSPEFWVVNSETN